MKKRQRRTVGSILEIKIENYKIHAQILHECDVVFFDTKDLNKPTIDEIINSPVLFRVGSNNEGILDGAWPKVGKAMLKKEFQKPMETFIQDPLNPESFEIYCAGEIRPATREECLKLTSCSVWAQNHIEDRIKDHYNGVPNKWAEQDKL